MKKRYEDIGYQYFDAGIAGFLYGGKQKRILYSAFDGFERLGASDAEIVKMEHEMWKHCREILLNGTSHPHVYLHPTFWGTRLGSVKTNTKKKYGKPNIHHIDVDVLSKNKTSMSQEVSKQWPLLNDTTSGYKLVILLIATQAKRRVGGLITHTNVLVVKRVKKQVSYYLFEPFKAEPTYMPPNFVQNLSNADFANFKTVNVCFGTQNSTWDCLHRSIDWSSQLLVGRVTLEAQKVFGYDVTSGIGVRRPVPLGLRS